MCGSMFVAVDPVRWISRGQMQVKAAPTVTSITIKAIVTIQLIGTILQTMVYEVSRKIEYLRGP